jgi:hypothetical protein
VRRVRALGSRAQRSHTRGHRLCLALHPRERNEFVVTRWSRMLWSVTRLVFWTKEPIGVHRSGIPRRAFQVARETSRSVEAVGNGPQPDRAGAVLALVVGDLARTWRKQRRERGSSARNGAVLETTIKESTWKP